MDGWKMTFPEMGRLGRFSAANSYILSVARLANKAGTGWFQARVSQQIQKKDHENGSQKWVGRLTSWHGSLTHYSQGFIHPFGGCLGFRSINSITLQGWLPPKKHPVDGYTPQVERDWKPPQKWMVSKMGISSHFFRVRHVTKFGRVTKIFVHLFSHYEIDKLRLCKQLRYTFYIENIFCRDVDPLKTIFLRF